MNSNINNSIDLSFDSKIALLLSCIYIFINIFYKKLEIIIIFILVIIIYTSISFYLDKDTILSKIPIIISFSILISFMFSLVFSNPYKENFSSKKKKKVKENFNSDNTTNDSNENNNSGDDDDDVDNFAGNNHIDLGTSFLEAYKNLDKTQINSMTKDTKELIKTQKTLMDTLQNLSPVVKEGKAIIDTFKGYFDKEEKK